MLLLLLPAVLCILIYVSFVRPLTYWKDRGVKDVKALPVFGSILQNFLRKKAFSKFLCEIYNTYPNERYVGFHQFGMPTLMMRDPDLIKQICIKDFEYFPEHRQFIREDADPLWSQNLFAMKGPKWRELRPTLSPCFTSSKMRAMYGLMSDCASHFTQHFLDKGPDTVVVEMKDVFTRYANDVIATCAFGVSCDSLKEKNNEFYLRGKEASDFTGLKGLRFIGHSVSPALMKLFGVKIFDQQTRSFFTKVIKETISLREREGIVRPDVINILMEARKGKQQCEDANVDTGFATVQESDYGRTGRQIKFTDEDIVAQALIFFIAGFDTAATLMCFVAYELAVNPDIQQRLYEEVSEAYQNSNGNVTYEALLGMKYLDMVLSESLRKWPPTPGIDRKSVRPYTIQPKDPGEKPVELPAGSVLFLPIFPLQRDPKHYPDPDKFDPERFSDENKHKINPFTYSTFGIGPRNCIGSRFALLENKTIIFHILLNFEIVPVEKTLIPMVMSPKDFTTTAEGGMWLGLKPRQARAC